MAAEPIDYASPDTDRPEKVRFERTPTGFLIEVRGPQSERQFGWSLLSLVALIVAALWFISGGLGAWLAVGVSIIWLREAALSRGARRATFELVDGELVIRWRGRTDVMNWQAIRRFELGQVQLTAARLLARRAEGEPIELYRSQIIEIVERICVLLNAAKEQQ